jgi:hypothetical protein
MMNIITPQPLGLSINGTLLAGIVNMAAMNVKG